MAFRVSVRDAAAKTMSSTLSPAASEEATSEEAAAEEAVLEALAQGKSVYLDTPGLPESPKNRALSGSLAAAQRELKNWGVLFTDGGRKRLITAEEARLLLAQGKRPGSGAVLTPLAKEIMEGKQ